MSYFMYTSTEIDLTVDPPITRTRFHYSDGSFVLDDPINPWDEYPVPEDGGDELCDDHELHCYESIGGYL